MGWSLRYERSSNSYTLLLVFLGWGANSEENLSKYVFFMSRQDTEYPLANTVTKVVKKVKQLQNTLTFFYLFTNFA